MYNIQCIPVKLFLFLCCNYSNILTCVTFLTFASERKREREAPSAVEYNVVNKKPISLI